MMSDSRTRGAVINDCSPKILPLSRSDCAICFAGDLIGTYPLMLHLANAIDAHQPARDRSVDIGVVKEHLLRVFNDILRGFRDWAQQPSASDFQFIFGGMSWRSKTFRLWTIGYNEATRTFESREANAGTPPIEKAAFIGDWASRARAKVEQARNRLVGDDPKSEFAPFEVIRDLIGGAGPSDTIGGVPQFIRIAEHMNTRVFAVRWPGESSDTYLMGRKLFDYENTDNWIIRADTLALERPRSFGNRQP